MQQDQLNYEQICKKYKDVVESMAFVALGKMRKPSPHSFEDLCQEGYIVCVEWVQRWFHPERGASLKTFITGGLRQHFTDLVWASFKDKSIPLTCLDPDGEFGESESDASDLRRSVALDPIENVSFNETLGRLTQEELNYITEVLTPIEVDGKRKMPSRTVVRKALHLSEETEAKLRASIQEKLEAQVVTG